MQLPEFWNLFLKTTQYTSAIISLTLNSILITLIITRSPKSLGMYKYLMIYIAIFEALYSILDVIAEPSILSYKAAFIVFRDFKHSIFGREQGFLLLVVYCACFGFSLAIFGVHFIYRYSTVDIKFRRFFLSGDKVYALFWIPIVYGIWWGIVSYIFCHYSETTNNYIRNGILYNYDIRLESISYGIALFYTAENEANVNVFLGVMCYWFMIVSSFSSVLFFGIRCYIKLSKALTTSDLTSCVTKSLQQQLFQALVCQTMIPVILMYIPIAGLFAFSMFNIDVGFASSFVTATIALYPATDPLPTMFIIKNYRRTLFCKTCRAGPPHTVGSSGDVVDN